MFLQLKLEFSCNECRKKKAQIFVLVISWKHYIPRQIIDVDEYSQFC
jgi:hypothetical protein